MWVALTGSHYSKHAPCDTPWVPGKDASALDALLPGKEYAVGQKRKDLVPLKVCSHERAPD